MVVACIVNIWLYWSALSTLPFGAINCRRMRTASSPPTMKKKNAATPYMMPSFLWSTVTIQSRQDVLAAGRLKTPRASLGLTPTVAPPATATSEEGRSMMAI